MALMLPWAGLVVAVAGIALLVAARWWPLRLRRRGKAVPFAAAQRFRALPRFRQLAKQQLRWLLLETISMVLAVAGIAMLIARPVEARSWASAKGNRDIMLCLDVSGSMAGVDKNVLRAFSQLTGQLEGERIGLMMFDSTGVVVFPLTDDASYIQEQLAAAEQEIGDNNTVVGTRAIDTGTSLIADGLMGCLERFDHRDQRRSRTVVLATDNQLSGEPLYSLEESFARARRDEVLVFGVMPVDNSASVTQELTRATRETGGDTMLLAETVDVASISDAVARTQRAALAQRNRLESEEFTWPWVGLVLVGLVAAATARNRRERK